MKDGFTPCGPGFAFVDAVSELLGLPMSVNKIVIEASVDSIVKVYAKCFVTKPDKVNSLVEIVKELMVSDTGEVVVVRHED